MPSLLQASHFCRDSVSRSRGDPCGIIRRRSHHPRTPKLICDHSLISPDSSVAPRVLAGFDVSTPARAGRPWYASPRRAEAVGSEKSVVGSTDELGGSRLMGSTSDDEVGPSGTVMRLAFSPTRTSSAARGSPPHGQCCAWSRLGSTASALGEVAGTDRGDQSPISPASSVAPRALAGFDVGTPASAGRPWRASPRRAEAIGSENSVVGSTYELRGSRLMGSSSDDEVGPSGMVRRLTFSPSRTSVVSPKAVAETVMSVDLYLKLLVNASSSLPRREVARAVLLRIVTRQAKRCGET